MSEAAKALSGADFPLNSFEDAAIELRRPFTAEAVKWKTQTGSLVVPFIDARLVTERLNLVIPHKWSDDYEPVVGGKDLLCRLTIDGITRIDTGGGYAMLKGNYSDAFKRAAVKFGIGVSLYALPKIFLSTDNGHLKKAKGDRLQLTDAGITALQKGYTKWLAETGERHFGKALDHGDVAGAIGDPDAESAPPTEQPELSPQPEKLTDAKATALTEAAEKLYAALPKAAKKGIETKAAFNRALAGVSHDHGELQKFVDDLEKRHG